MRSYWAIEERKYVYEYSSEIVDCLLSRVPKYKTEHWMLYIITNVATTLYQGFVFETPGYLHKLPSGWQPILDAVDTLLESDCLLFRSRGADLYILFHASCRLNQEHTLAQEGMHPAKHERILHMSLDVLHDACKDLSRDVFGKEWSLEREMKFTKVMCTTSDASAQWLAWRYRKAAIKGYAEFCYSWSRFLFANQVLDIKLKMEEKDGVILELATAFQRSCSFMYCRADMGQSRTASEQTKSVFYKEMKKWIELLPDFSETQDEGMHTFSIENLFRTFKSHITQSIIEEPPQRLAGVSIKATPAITPFGLDSPAKPFTSTRPGSKAGHRKGAYYLDVLPSTRGSAERKLHASPGEINIDPKSPALRITKQSPSASVKGCKMETQGLPRAILTSPHTSGTEVAREQKPGGDSGNQKKEEEMIKGPNAGVRPAPYIGLDSEADPRKVCAVPRICPPFYVNTLFRYKSISVASSFSLNKSTCSW